MEKFKVKLLFALFLTLLTFTKALPWGFFAHKNINRLAVFTLPPEMAGFYKKHIEFITETAVAPDKRRYAVKEEGARHYIDLDYYRDTLGMALPISWKMADSLIPEDFRQKHGVLPWHLGLMKFRLTEAFKKKDQKAILKLSAEIGHYIGDACVPLHTCSNYNGQLTNQHGIHGFWESRLPELYFKEYEFWVGPAEYIKNSSDLFWNIVLESNQAVDSVLAFEKNLSDNFPSGQKYSFEERGATMVKVYSKEYCQAYHQLLSGQVERQMRKSVKTIGNIWYTCWVDAGKPDLAQLNEGGEEEEFKKEDNVAEHQECNH